ncbi:MAG TPA: DUF3299 domain-containing protein [Ramlibacter sp.]|nr:DUF3299 domain-containing protein [Ramlibacter sp.]
MTLPRWTFAIVVIAVAAGAAATSYLLLRPAAPGSAQGTQAVAYRNADWEELVPKDWDPIKKFRDANFGAMQDSDPRAMELLRQMRETWDNAPTNNALDNQPIRIPGYVVPIDETKSGLSEFLLVPYFGACIHTPPPPANQIIDVKLSAPNRDVRMMEPVWVSGRLTTLRSTTAMGASGYSMEAVLVEPYVEKEKAR